MAGALEDNVIPQPRVAATILQSDPEGFNFIAHDVLSPISDARRDGKIRLLDRSDMLRGEGDTLNLADGQAYPRVSYGTSYQQFFCEKFGDEAQVTEEDLARHNGETFDARTEAARMARATAMRKVERDVAGLVMNTSTFNVTDVTGGTAWSDSSANIIDEVTTAVETVRGRTGHRPNALVVTPPILQYILTNDDIKARFNDGVVTEQQIRGSLAAIFGLDRLIVGDAVVNSANEGASDSIGDVWDTDASGEHAMVARVALSGRANEPCIGRTVRWNAFADMPLAVGSYPEPQTNSEVIQVRTYEDHKILDSELGQLIKVTS